MLKNGWRQEQQELVHFDTKLSQNGPEMAQKWHFFKLSTIFSHDHWWDIGKIYFSTYTRAGQFNFFSGGGFRVVSRHIDEYLYYKTMGLYFNPRGAPYDQRFSFSQETKKYEIYENPKIWKQKWADLEQKYYYGILFKVFLWLFHKIVKAISQTAFEAQGGLAFTKTP